MIKRKEHILNLRDRGYSYRQIQNELKCSRGTISFHLGIGQKEKYRIRNNKNRRNNPLIRKLSCFICRKTNTSNLSKVNCKIIDKIIYSRIWCFSGKTKNMNITLEQVKRKIGDNPICYLTGDPIDISKSRSYHFDHIIPSSRGGQNTLENLGICTKEANQAKHDRTLEEFIELCKKVLIHNGYKIEKIS